MPCDVLHNTTAWVCCSLQIDLFVDTWRNNKQICSNTELLWRTLCWFKN